MSAFADVLASDHRSLTDLLADAQAERDPAEFRAYCEQLTTEFVRHVVAEEQYVHPLLRAAVGEDTVADLHEADRAAEDVLRELEDVDSDRASALPLLAILNEKLDAHVATIEPLLDTLAVDDPDALADDLLGAEQVAPTRPRAVAPENPALNKLTALAGGFVDLLRDHYGHRPVPHEDE